VSADRDTTGRRIVRYRFGERVAHMFAALSYVYLLLTGLAFWMPALYWLAIVLGGGFLVRAVHPWIGIVFSVVVAWMFAKWRRDMATTDADRAWRKAIKEYVRNEDHRVPPAGKFNLGQKQLFWLMVWGGLALLASGLVLWVPQSMPPLLRQAAVLVHAVASLATIAGFIVHVYMGLAVVPGGLGAILNGEVTEEWARLHHPLWAAEVTGVRRADLAAPATTSGVTTDAASRQ
jgi:formate dehydrogenase subunit gamma